MATVSSSPAEPEIVETQCCIAGGGPAGMMLGLLLARAGVTVTVLEKHADFLRDFRGDTIHPSTLELMHELGVLEELLKLPHRQARQITGYIGGEQVTVADFSHLRARCPYIAFMPQWHFLNFLAAQAQRYPTFSLRLEADVVELVEEAGSVTGVRATTPGGQLVVNAQLVVGADGRHSTVRRAGGFEVQELGAPMDVLWLRLSRQAGDPSEPLGHFDRGKVFVMLDRGDFWQCGYVIPKGTLEELREKGIEGFRLGVAEIAPFTANRVHEIESWDQVKLLTVAVNRLSTWCRPGLLCIGDAAHAMSPVGGVGINLAIQDAVAAANELAAPLRENNLTLERLRAVQRRREFPTRATQRIQIAIQNRILKRVLASSKALRPPWPFKLLQKFPYLRRIPARVMGIGVRPEHVRTPEAHPPAGGSAAPRPDARE